MPQFIKRLFLLGCFFLCSFSSYAQWVNSPYSIQGIGDIQSQGLAHNMAMGGLGISNGSTFYLNTMNPALLTRNQFTVFSAGMEGVVKNISTTDAEEQHQSGNVNYLAFGFPVIPNRWTMSIGLMPYSTVSYEYATTRNLTDGNAMAISNYMGSGGTTKAYFANGVKIIENLSVGFQASYIFGSIIEEAGVSIRASDSLPDANANFSSVSYDRTQFSDFTFSLGLAYRFNLKGKTFLNLGAIYELENNTGVTRYSALERRGVNNAAVISSIVLEDNVPGNLLLPARFGGGISIERTFNYLIGIDFSMQDWSEFNSFSGTSENMGESFQIALGGEFIPDVSSVDSYFNRVTYRLGGHFERTPFMVNGQDINDFGINFGMSLPVSRLSNVDLAVRFGQRGTTNAGLLQEQYVKFFLGVSFNDRWFIRRKFD